MVCRYTQIAAISAILMLSGCHTTPRTMSGSFADLKRTEFMALYQGCLEHYVPQKPTRTSVALLNHFAKQCMRMANRTVQ